MRVSLGQTTSRFTEAVERLRQFRLYMTYY
jgi:hypothetical protein